MQRRDLFRMAVAGASGWVLDHRHPERRAEAAEPVSAEPVSVDSDDFPLGEVSVAQLQAGLRDGRYTARALIELYRERIRQIDQAGPRLNAVIELNPDALAAADRLDRQRAAGQVCGPWHGIPVLLKDNIETADPLMTTAGSLALAGYHAPQDAFIAQKLRAAGAIVLGKTNLSEWANFRSTRSVSGWSGRGGQTRNPYALDRNPCGSSAGSGVAASANLCAAAVGTETNGSIVCPSSVNGVVGIKPTVGLVSRSGIVPLAHSQDVAGPMARCVADAAAMLTCMAGSDPRDPVTAEADAKATDYTDCLDAGGLKDRRIGVVRALFGFHEKVDQVLEQAVADLSRLGATLVDPVELNTRGAGRAGMTVLLYEFKADLNRYLAGLPDTIPVHSLQELIAFNEQHADQELPYFGQELFLMAQEKGDLSDPEYLEALETMHRGYRDEGIDATLARHELDALVAPTSGPAWVTDWIHGDHGLGGSSTPAARAGYPHVTVPAGVVFGLPVGISFFSRAYSEPLLIRLAYAFEQGTRHRRPPGLRPQADFG